MTPAGDAWTAWSTATPVLLSVAHDGWVRVRLPIAVAPDADGRFTDLRVVNERGRETPYAVDPAGVVTGMRDVPVVSSAFLPRRGTVAVLDAGRARGAVDRIVLGVDVEQRPSFFERVGADASRDRRHWRALRSEAVIYRVADDDGKGRQDVTFPPTRDRWLRIRVLDPHAPFPITDATVSRVGPAWPPLVPLPVAPASAVDTQAHRQIWTFAASVPFRPSAVSFGNTPGTFVRPVRVESSADGTAWAFAGDGTIARYADGTVQTSFAFPEDTAPAWRVVVENGDNPPLAGRGPALLGVPHDIVFGATPGHSYALLSGNGAATPASYDLGVRLAHQRWSWTMAATGNSGRRAAYRDPRVATRRTAWLAVGVVVVVAFAAAALLALRRPRSRPATS